MHQNQRTRQPVEKLHVKWLLTGLRTACFLALVAALLAAPFEHTPARAASEYGEENQDGPGSTIYLPLVSSEDPLGSGEDSNKISNVFVTSSQIGRYDKFEMSFAVRTSASNPSLPYDPDPPPGVKPGIGISVDVLFSPDNWQTTLVQPAFFNQPYNHSVQGGKDHFTPSGPPRWTVRFTPQRAGSWQYRVRVQDASGTAFYPVQGGLPFTAGDTSSSKYAQRGFLRVSSKDSRYFEFQDGSPFIGVGFNDGYHETARVEEKMQAFEQNKMNFMRVWMSGAGINGSQWSSWASHHVGHDGYIPGVSLDTQNTYQGGDVSLKLGNSNPCLFGDFWQDGIPVTPGTGYTVWARFKVSDVTGPASSGDYGFVIKQSGWLDKDCNRADKGKPITKAVNGSSDWMEVSGTYTTGSSQYWLDNLYLTMQNATGGNVYIDEVRVWRTDDPAKVNILRDPNANSHMVFDPMNSALWDRFIESAERHGVYLKIVIDEKNEWIRNRLNSEGNMVEKPGNDNFYAGPGTKVRWLHQAWWRYLIARWGYSTAIHSFELINEGDPYNGKHHAIANAMGRYFRENDPSRHMVSTSFWAGFPNSEFWSNPEMSYIDYADIHAYISTGWGLYAMKLNDSNRETNPSYVYAGTGSARINGSDNSSQEITPRGLVIQGQGEWVVRYWMKSEGFTANCSDGSSGGMQRVRWSIDGGKVQGIAPANKDGRTSICTSPGGSYDWREFRSDKDRNGDSIPSSYRLILNDDKPHTLSISIENERGTGGRVWIDEIHLIDPSGKKVNVLGRFDPVPMDEDTAWYNMAYGEVFGGGNGAGAPKPLIRGETGIDSPNTQDWNRDLLKDTNGIWLHNNVWGQINHGGMYDLFWWSSETILPGIYPHFLTYRNFMEGIPLSNGAYDEVQARASRSELRAWGQRDDDNGRMHLWIQNTKHTWKRVVNGESYPAISGSVTIQNVPDGRYEVEWWDTYKTSNPVFSTQTLDAGGGTLKLDLPSGFNKDVAVKIKRLP